MIKIKKDLN